MSAWIIKLVKQEAFRKNLRVTGIVFGVALLLFQMLQAFQAYLNSGLRIASPGLLIIAVAVIFFAIAQQMLAWSFLMQSLGVSIPWNELTKGYMLSFLPRYIPGTVWGYISRGEWLLQDYRVSYGVSNVGSLLEIAVAVLANIVVLVLYSINRSAGVERIGMTIGIVVVIFFIWLILQRVLSFPVIRKRLSKQENPVQIHFLQWSLCLGLVVLNMFLYGIALNLTIAALNIEQAGLISGSHLLLLAANFSAAWLTGFLVFIFPSGLGLREVTLSGLLTLNFGLSFQVASTASVFFRLVVTFAELLWVVIAGWSIIKKRLRIET